MFLEHEGWIKYHPVKKYHSDVTITLDGWKRVAELTKTAPSRKEPAFVAMWFAGNETEEGALMERAWATGILAAITTCDYKGERVDLVQHNEYIMDKVRGMIRVAPFLVADLTGQRHGVYMEAGMAMGRDIPVIVTCRTSDFGNIHFDAKQLNIIQWETPEELRERLKNRILGTVGRGPYSADSFGIA